MTKKTNDSVVQIICNLCGADDWELHLPASIRGIDEIDVAAFRCTSSGYGSHAQIVRCKRCGYLYANPRWSATQLMDAYGAVEDATYVAERQGRELTFAKHLQAMEKQVGTANGRSLLDVGAYVGIFVEAALAAGWAAVGVEPSSWAAKEAQQEGLPIICGTQDAPELENKVFDVITMWDVIEHVDDPSAEMAKAFGRLKPGGWLVVHTMDVDSWASRILRARWPWYMDMHIHYFSQRTMRQMLEKNGFKVKWSGVQGRYLTLSYLGTRVAAWHRGLGRLVNGVIHGLRLGKTAVPINFGDLFTAYAQKPFEANES